MIKTRYVSMFVTNYTVMNFVFIVVEWEGGISRKQDYQSVVVQTAVPIYFRFFFLVFLLQTSWALLNWYNVKYWNLQSGWSNVGSFLCSIKMQFRTRASASLESLLPLGNCIFVNHLWLVYFLDLTCACDESIRVLGSR